MDRNLEREWLEADGLGGFASGTVSGVRTRRYHALLLAAVTPPTGRMALVNGFEAHVRTQAGRFALSSQRYAPDVLHPDGWTHIESFTHEPWPQWVFRLPDGTRVEQSLFAVHGAACVVVRFRALTPARPLRLELRPLLSGRDYHGLQRENPAFRFAADGGGRRLRFRPYDGVPAVISLANAEFHAAPDWYRNFLYSVERERGLDCVEDLACPGMWEFDLASGPASWIIGAEGLAGELETASDAAVLADALAERERAYRSRFASPRDRAADAYLVARGRGQTLVAGYPWFTDWGRDTFIAMRGLCIATRQLTAASAILREWAAAVSRGMLPNRFPDRGGSAEYNAVDASLWYIIAVSDVLRTSAADGCELAAADRNALTEACEAILTGYTAGTRHGIRCDHDGLLACGEPGVQLTWMDAKIGEWVVTPRVGKPVEVQALWLNALAIAGEWNPRWRELSTRGRAAFEQRFWNESKQCLYDVIDVDHDPGRCDASMRPNQIFAVGGLPESLLSQEKAARVVAAVEAELLTPVGLRSLAASEPGYAPQYVGGPAQRDATYHQGTVWPWLLGPFVEAFVRVRGNTSHAKREAERRFVAPLRERIDAEWFGHVCEIADAEPPHAPRGCPLQAWSLGEIVRLERSVLSCNAPGSRSE